MKLNSKIYIAGHHGLVGSAIVRALKKNGYKNLILKSFDELDLRNQKRTLEFFEEEKPDYVFLAAAKVGGIFANNSYKAEFIYDNLMIAANIIHSSYKFNVKKLLNLGSSCIYPKMAQQPLKEDCLLSGKLEPTNEPYAIAKIAAIKLCKFYNEQYGTNFISVMPTNLYGSYDNFNLQTSHVLPSLMRRFRLAELLCKKQFVNIRVDLQKFPVGFDIGDIDDPFSIAESLEKIGVTKDTVTLWGSGEPYREFLFVDDLAEALMFLMKNYDANEIGEFVNIGTGQDLKIKSLAFLLKQIVGFEGYIKFDNSKPDGTPRKLLNIERIKKLGWQSKTTLYDGLCRTYDWYLGNLLDKNDLNKSEFKKFQPLI